MHATPLCVISWTLVLYLPDHHVPAPVELGACLGIRGLVELLRMRPHYWKFCLFEYCVVTGQTFASLQPKAFDGGSCKMDEHPHPSGPQWAKDTWYLASCWALPLVPLLVTFLLGTRSMVSGYWTLKLRCGGYEEDIRLSRLWRSPHRLTPFVLVGFFTGR